MCVCVCSPCVLSGHLSNIYLRMHHSSGERFASVQLSQLSPNHVSSKQKGPRQSLAELPPSPQYFWGIFKVDWGSFKVAPLHLVLLPGHDWVCNHDNSEVTRWSGTGVSGGRWQSNGGYTMRITQVLRACSPSSYITLAASCTTYNTRDVCNTSLSMSIIRQATHKTSHVYLNGNPMTRIPMALMTEMDVSGNVQRLFREPMCHR